MPVDGSESFGVITIDEVDVSNRSVTARDKTHSRFWASFRNMPGGIVYIPVAGEQWVVQKVGHIWYLHSRLSTVDEQTVTANLPDGSSNILGIPHVNGSPWGAPRVESASGTSFTTHTLALTPVSPSIQAFFGGSLIAPSAWSISGKTLTFSPALGSGTLVVYYQA